MVQGMYTAVAGMLPRINQESNITNNLANQNTNGYKKGLVFLRQLITAQYALDHANGVNRTEVPEDVRIDFSQGTLDQTDDTYDLALKGKGFFRVGDATGATLLTRNGRFYLDPGGYLIDSKGMNLLNVNLQPIRIEGQNVKIMGNGDIFEDGEFTDTIGFTDVAPGDYQNLEDRGNALFARPASVQEIQPGADVRVLQGYLEDANVDPIVSMVDMIESFRMYELGQKSIQIQDSTLQRVVSEVGAIR